MPTDPMDCWSLSGLEGDVIGWGERRYERQDSVGFIDVPVKLLRLGEQSSTGKLRESLGRV